MKPLRKSLGKKHIWRRQPRYYFSDQRKNKCQEYIKNSCISKIKISQVLKCFIETTHIQTHIHTYSHILTYTEYPYSNILLCLAENIYLNALLSKNIMETFKRIFSPFSFIYILLIFPFYLFLSL